MQKRTSDNNLQPCQLRMVYAESAEPLSLMQRAIASAALHVYAGQGQLIGSSVRFCIDGLRSA